MTQSIICHRAFEFAVRTVKLCEKVAARGFGARHIAHQLIRCGTSICVNAEEAQEGQSKADYIAKLCVSSKEARETADGCASGWHSRALSSAKWNGS